MLNSSTGQGFSARSPLSWRRDSNPQPPVYKSQSAMALHGPDLQEHQPPGTSAPDPAACVPYEWAPMSASGTEIRWHTASEGEPRGPRPGQSRPATISRLVDRHCGRAHAYTHIWVYSSLYE